MAYRKDSIWKTVDWWTIALYVILVMCGWLSVCGASYDYGDPDFFSLSTRAGKQLMWIGCSFGLGFVLLMIEERFYDTYAYLIYGILLLLLFGTIFNPHEIKGSRSWIVLGPVSLQPAEFAKFATALALAKYIGEYTFSMEKGKNLMMALGIILVPMVLIVCQKETGSALVYLSFFLVLYREGMTGAVLFSGICAVVYFIVGIRFSEVMMPDECTSWGDFSVMTLIVIFSALLVKAYGKNYSRAFGYILLAGLGTILLGVLFSLYVIPYDVAVLQAFVFLALCIYLVYLFLRERLRSYLYILFFALGSVGFFYSADYVFNDVLEPHQQVRIKVLLGMEDDPTGAGYNVNQSKIAIGSGGFLGKGFSERYPDQTEICAGTGYRFHFLYGRGRRRVLGCGRSIGVVPGAHSPLDSLGRAPTLCLWAYLWLLCDECFPVPCVYQRGNGVGTYAGYRYSVAVLQLRRFILVGLHHLVVRIPAYRCRTQSGQEGLRL